MTLALLCKNKGPSAVCQQKFRTVLTLNYLYGLNPFNGNCYHQIDLLAIQQTSLDRALFLYIFIHEIRPSGVRASITIVHIRKFYKMWQSIVRLRFFFRIAKRSIDTFLSMANFKCSMLQKQNQFLFRVKNYGKNFLKEFQV